MARLGLRDDELCRVLDADPLTVIAGELDHRIGDDTVSLTAGGTIHVPTGVVHQGINTGSTVAEMIVALGATLLVSWSMARIATITRWSRIAWVGISRSEMAWFR